LEGRYFSTQGIWGPSWVDDAIVVGDELEDMDHCWFIVVVSLETIYLFKAVIVKSQKWHSGLSKFY